MLVGKLLVTCFPLAAEHAIVLSDNKKMTAYLPTMVVILPCPCQGEVDQRGIVSTEFSKLLNLSLGEKYCEHSSGLNA